VTIDDVKIRPGKAGVRFDVRVVPRGSKSAVEGVRDGALLVRVTAPPVGGAANTAVVDLVADLLGVARRDVSVVTGQTSRRKVLEIRGIDETAVRSSLSAILR